ncbi:hypothetical protein P152DRAFT_474507 [Eremomyces bilateralis CBS 781.70]|uniref:U3 small nucleolar RNA-associated protein 10 n=1 Tax=Eremomyces bilateralis CBS 781.70 TaxID=1392243 RepID=A0A6G1G0Z8_9PEZI|nr:uncharacterized protein P152DRAFT_474507 [Eremomyces bilateralis CBS 781.70]KAF1811785.1 hypothetical protein P152DRAFT_474507 [Eremomyces bilateralis CBS 781.70]
MPSSLQQQLAQIAQNSTRQLDLKAQKVGHSKSFLFEPKVAAKQDFNTIFQICIEGFEEICALDRTFGEYRETLFSEQSKVEDRTQMNAEEQSQLNETLATFLIRISSKLLLKPGLKCVEWLVRRFRVHEYNTERLLFAFLPYFESPIFPLVLSIIPERNLSEPVRFLYPYIQARENPRMTAIQYTAANNRSFFRTLNNYVLEVVKTGYHFPTLLSFWTCVIVHGIDGRLESARAGVENVRRQKQEDALLEIIPVLNEGFALTHAPDMILACIMITTVLASKSAPGDKVIKPLMSAVVGASTEDVLDESLMCLVVLAEEIESEKVPKSVMKFILETDAPLQSIHRISEQASVDKFVHACITTALANPDGRWINRVVPFFQELVESHSISPRAVKNSLSLLINAVRTSGRPDGNTELCQQVGQSMRHIAQEPSGVEMIRNCAESQGLSVGEIEQATLTQILGDAAEVVEMEVDPLPIEAQAALPSDELSERLASVPEANTRSFLSTYSSETLDTFEALFQQVYTDSDRLQQLCEAPLFWPNDELNNMLFITFLIRIWTGKMHPSCKQAALAVGKLWLSSSAHLGNSVQIVVPYLLLALTDSSRIVREAAAAFLKDLADTYTYLSSAKASTMVAPWTFDAVYSRSQSAWSSLSTEEASKLLNDQLVPMLEECILDRDLISNALISIFGRQSEPSHSPRLKPAHLAATYNFLSSHAVATPLLHIRTKLLQFLRNPGKPGITAHKSVIQPALRQWVELAPSAVSAVEEEQGSSVPELSDAYFATVPFRDPTALAFLLELIRPTSRLRPDTAAAVFERIKTLWREMSDSVKGGFANAMFELIITEDVQTPELPAHAYEKFQSLSIPTVVILDLVESLLRHSETPSGQHRRKRARLSDGDGARQSHSETSTVLRKFSFVLEYLHSSLANMEASTTELLGLLKALFSVLDELLALSSTVHSDLVFLQVLTMDSLKGIVERLSDRKFKLDDPSSVRMDTLVNCLRKSSNPQVQTNALVLVTHLASWNPEVVLQNVMPIFTFMGHTILRQSDEFSAHVIKQILRQIVPPLVISLQRSNVGIVQGASSLLHSFTAAFEHIPLHRRLDLFQNLALNLGPAESLHAIIAMLAEKYPQDETVYSFCSSLLARVGPYQALETIGRYTKLLCDAAMHQPGDLEAILAIKGKTNEEFDSTLVGLLHMLSALVDNESFRARLKKSGKPVSGQHEIFSDLITDAIKLNQACRRSTDVSTACSKALAGVFRLLPTGDLIKSADMLLQRAKEDSDGAEILPILFRSIDAQVRRLNQSDRSSSRSLVAFVPKIATIISMESVQSKTYAIACIDQIIRRFGKMSPDAVASAAQVIAGKDALGLANPKVRTAALLCLSSCVEVLRDDFISLAPEVLSALHQYLKADGNEPNSLFVPGYMLLISLCEHAAFLFAGSILDKILGLVHASSAASLTKEEVDMRQHFLEVLSQRVDARELFQAIDRTMNDAMSSNLEATTLQLGLLQTTLQHHPNAIAIKNSAVLFSILLKAFNLRASRSRNTRPAEIQKLENLAVDVAMDMTMKVNDSTFRPFFSQMIEWGNAPLEGDEVRIARWTTVFRFIETLFASLKSLMTSYASYILEPVSKLLEIAPINTDEGATLVKAVMQALQRNLEHDQDDFWQAPAHFKELMNPLLDLFTRAPPSILNEDVIPTVVELAVTAASPDHHKEINSRLIQHLRSILIVPRLAAVKCEQALTERLGEEWLLLLAELLPVISELQEDDNETVEKETVRWIKMTSGILGEDLDAMLR